MFITFFTLLRCRITPRFDLPRRGVLPYMMHCSMSLLCCFLGRFLPKLGGTSVPPFFRLSEVFLKLQMRQGKCASLAGVKVKASPSMQ